MKKYLSDYFAIYLFPVLCLVGCLYFLVITQGTWQFAEYNQGIYSNWLAEVFISGRTGVPINSPEAVPTGDGSIYKGMLYLYWGPVPALLHALFILATGAKLYTSVSIFLAAIANVGMLWLIIINFFRRFVGDVKVIYVLAPVIAYVGGPLLFNQGRGFVYEEAVVLASTFFLASLLIISLGWFNDRRAVLGKSLLAGVFFALAIGTRFNFLFFFPLLIGYLYVGTRSPGNLRRKLIAFCVAPILACSLIGYYNFARFGSITEFGVTHQNASIKADVERIRSGAAVSWQYIPYNFAHYFLRPVFLGPHGSLLSWEIPGTTGDFPRPTRAEETISVLLASPILFFGFATLLRRREMSADFKKIILVSIFGLGIFLAFGLLSFLGNAYRYAQDFAPILYILSAIGISLALKRAESGWKYGFVFSLVVLSVIYGFTLGARHVCSVFIGAEDNCLKINRPLNEFHKLN